MGIGEKNREKSNGFYAFREALLSNFVYLNKWI